MFQNVLKYFDFIIKRFSLGLGVAFLSAAQFTNRARGPCRQAPCKEGRNVHFGGEGPGIAGR
jgi:hypothetical protein